MSTSNNVIGGISVLLSSLMAGICVIITKYLENQGMTWIQLMVVEQIVSVIYACILWVILLSVEYFWLYYYNRLLTD